MPYPIGPFLSKPHTIRFIPFIFLLLHLLILIGQPVHATDSVNKTVVFCSSDIYEDYLQLLNGRDPTMIRDYGGAYSRRDTIELVLLQQALALGGYSQAIEFFAEDSSYKRMLNIVSRGEVLSGCTTVFEQDLKDFRQAFMISDVMIHANEFIAGLFVRADRVDEVKIRNKTDIAKYRAVCNENWPMDIQVLKSLAAQCINAASWSQMVNLLYSGRADFMLAPFQSAESGVLLVDDKKFLPIPGVKVQLGSKRHFLISKAHPYHEQFSQALNVGISKLREKGLIRKAYTDSGFFNTEVADWVLLNEK